MALGAAENYSQTSGAYTPDLSYNDGFRKRLYNLNYVGSSGSVASQMLTSPQTVGMNYWTQTGAGAATLYYSNIIAKLRLKDLCDFFEKMPLSKGCFFKITINANTSSNVVTVGAGGILSLAAASSVSIVGKTNPVMIASASTGNPLAGWAAAQTPLTVACGISSLSIGATTATHQVYRTCRLYCPLYTMNPSYEESFLQMSPVKTIVYNDLYQFSIPNVAAGAQINSLISNGIVAPKMLVVIPILNRAAQNNCFDVAVDPIQSPFASEPGTTSFGAALTQANVQISGLNLYQSNVQYDFELFLQELSKTGLNGGMTTSLGSGLINEA
jgi:hypothetical protein